MSGSWNPRRGELPPQWERHRRRHIAAAELRIGVWIALILGLLLLQATRLWPPPRDEASLAIEASAQPLAEARGQAARGAVRVIDGDTFDLGGQRIRVADIDTPELRGRCADEVRLAARATARMRILLAAGPFELRPNPDGRDEDRYGRKLRIVTRDGRSLGSVLVAEGLARRWTGRRQPWC